MTTRIQKIDLNFKVKKKRKEWKELWVLSKRSGKMKLMHLLNVMRNLKR